jgi:hypothetical protein
MFCVSTGVNTQSKTRDKLICFVYWREHGVAKTDRARKNPRLCRRMGSKQIQNGPYFWAALRQREPRCDGRVQHQKQPPAAEEHACERGWPFRSLRKHSQRVHLLPLRYTIRAQISGGATGKRGTINSARAYKSYHGIIGTPRHNTNQRGYCSTCRIVAAALSK